jgi:hypothetical protein
MQSFCAVLFIGILRLVSSTTCVCTTVPCPEVGVNKLTMGDGNADVTYTYIQHGDYVVVSEAKAVLSPESLGKGTDTTDCTRKYSRMLEDDGDSNCDAGHILAKHLGGYGNEPLNLFPQNHPINSGIFAQFEGKIYDCMQEADEGNLSWLFTYRNATSTQPISVDYSASFDKGCSPLNEIFDN